MNKHVEATLTFVKSRANTRSESRSDDQAALSTRVTTPVSRVTSNGDQRDASDVRSACDVDAGEKVHRVDVLTIVSLMTTLSHLQDDSP